MVMFSVHQVWPRLSCKHSERGKKTRQTEEKVGRQHQGMNRPGVQQVPEGSGEQGKMEKTSCKIICGAPMTLVVQGLMMMMTYLEGLALIHQSFPSVTYLEGLVLIHQSFPSVPYLEGLVLIHQ